MKMNTFLFGLIFSFLSFANETYQCAKLGQSLTPRDGGPPGSQGFENSCCSGLKHAENKHACGKAYGGYGGLCLSCGDKKCDNRYENKCNCPDDCKNPTP